MVQIRGEVDARDVLKLLRTLARIEPKLARKHLRKGIEKGCRIVRNSAKQKVRKRYRILSKSLGVKIKTYFKTKTIIGIVGPRRDYQRVVKGKRIVPVFYAHLVEFGTKAHAVGKEDSIRKGIQRGVMHPGSEPFPFMRPAWDENKLQVVEEIRKELVIGIQEASRGGL